MKNDPIFIMKQIAKRRKYGEKDKQIREETRKLREESREIQDNEFKCECGSILTKEKRRRHENSKKHQIWLLDQKQIAETIKHN